MICYYHMSDLDGQCSGAIVKYYHPSCRMVGLRYDDKVNWDDVIGQNVVMVDISLRPIENMISVAKLAKKMVWIDHHKSIMDQYDEFKDAFGKKFVAILSDERLGDHRAACELTWKFFSGKKYTPIGIHLIGRYDVWDHEAHPDVLPFQYGMRMYDTFPVEKYMDTVWNKIIEDDQSFYLDTVEKGKAVFQFVNKDYSAFRRANAFESVIDGYRCICLNRISVNSRIFGDLIYDYDMAVIFGYKGKGKWKVSFYTARDDIDVSKIAERYGGGGHKHAGGAIVDSIDFILKGEKHVS